MRPRLILRECKCCPPKALAIKALFQEEFDGEWIYFWEVCLFCDHEKYMKTDFDNWLNIPAEEEAVMKYLASDSSKGLITLAMQGKTHTIPHKWKKGDDGGEEE